MPSLASILFGSEMGLGILDLLEALVAAEEALEAPSELDPRVLLSEVEAPRWQLVQQL